jgi:signal transduction histidine kinase
VRLPQRLTALTATLLVLLPTLAVLQYRWVGELGDAARDRMQRNLHNAAQQFRDAFDSEIARAFVSLQADRELSAGRYAERYGAWASTTAYPWLVSNVFVVDAPEGALRLHRWDAATRTFAPAQWTGALASARARFAAELTAFASGASGPGPRLDRPAVAESEELLIAPLPRLHMAPGSNVRHFTAIQPAFGFTLIELNLAAVRDRLLPALAHRYFSPSGEESYHVAVVDTAQGGKLLYRSTADAPTDPSRADVSVPLFHAHHDPMLFLARGAIEDLRAKGDTRNLVVSVLREPRGERLTIQSRALPERGRWRLLAQHGRGSLEAAVADVRRRNLLISSGILLLMGVTIGLLAQTSRRAHHLAQQRMEFVAGVSHELRTPVAVIRSAAENLSHGVVGDPERVRRYGDTIRGEALRLGEMIERVLHFAGIESGRVVRAPVAIEPLVHNALEAALPAGGAAFTVETQIAPNLPPVDGDAAALRSAVQNLIANGIKYGGADRWIRVRVEAGPEKRDPYMMVLHDRKRMLLLPRGGARRPEIRVTVEDHGAGIPTADLPHIFEPFYRGADARARQTQGSGLGLALVARIVAAHGGRVSVTTREGEGSAFTLHLPAAVSTHETVPLQSPNEAAAG